MRSEITVLESIAREAGAFIVSDAVDTTSTDKTNTKDFVTVADIKSQNIIADRLAAAFPGAIVLSEEHPEEDRKQLYEPGFSGFVIDPIDGTYVFKRGLKESCISIGHITDGNPDYGVIYDPYKDEMYTVSLGEGAFRNGKAIQVHGQTELRGASVVTSNSYDDEAMVRNLRRHISIFEQTGVMPWTTCPGSGVLIMTNVACGRYDAYHHNGLKPWDNAVGFLLVREAGGVVHDLHGADAHFTSQTVVMGHATVVAQLESVFSKYPEYI